MLCSFTSLEEKYANIPFDSENLIQPPYLRISTGIKNKLGWKLVSLVSECSAMSSSLPPPNLGLTLLQ